MNESLYQITPSLTFGGIFIEFIKYVHIGISKLLFGHMCIIKIIVFDLRYANFFHPFNPVLVDYMSVKFGNSPFYPVLICYMFVLLCTHPLHVRSTSVLCVTRTFHIM